MAAVTAVVPPFPSPLSSREGMDGAVAVSDPRSGPLRRFPVTAVDDILKDVLGSYLREQQYEPARCRDMAKDIAEVIKARVRDLMIPR
ncbi:dynein light chain Tctex-type 5 [Colius striatus]|uniref:dynein light chain Tctex-type 5 n=1 Tax=Colius striatus TaxID=57412 RepID=UPI002B1DE2BA|nr:dynein light chain Tctex-type 5 [Colius striatus]